MRRKMILALVLAIVSSAWMINEASNWCMPSIRTMTQLWIEVNGTFQAEGFPCEPGEECPTCLTIVLVTSDKTYYLVTDNGQLIEYLDTIPLGTKATVSGIPFEHGSYDYIQVSHIETDHTSQLPSLCDEWNVWHESFESFGPINFNQVIKYRLTTDTIINGQTYLRLVSGSSTYVGALREGNNRDIYYIPEWQTHEYLLYAFNAQVGDTLSNLWAGGFGDSYQAVVQAISDDTTRIFTIDVKYEYEPGSIQWIEGVGSPETPMGKAVVPDVPADLGVYTLLCAYKNGEQVYSSSKSERYGCEFNGIPSTKPYHLCDEWNILEISNVTCGGCEAYRTFTSRLTTDTVINEIVYTRLIEDGMYKGAIRQGNDTDIYYIPAESTHEYLLYAFNAQVGDVLSNLWVGRMGSDNPDGLTMTVEEILETNPRTFILSTGFTHPEEDLEVFPLYITWIEGVGLPDGPVGGNRYDGYADSRGQVVLCAYKNGEQVYVSEMGEQYGCVYNYDPYTPSDTIPLFTYIGDDPGSSTVDPVDPNQVVATLRGDELTIREHTGVDIAYSLQHNAPTKMPAHLQASTSDTFRDEITLQITESGEYQLLLTNPSWDYSIYGTFFYLPQGIESVHSTSVPQKVLQNGQFYILRNEKIYTITGQKLK